MLDSGLVEILEVENESMRGAYPVKKTSLKFEECFEERTVGMSRFYAARQANVTVDRVIRIWRREDVSTQDVARIGAELFDIRQVQHVFDKDELAVTDLTLERTVQRYDAG